MTVKSLNCLGDCAIPENLASRVIKELALASSWSITGRLTCGDTLSKKRMGSGFELEENNVVATSIKKVASTRRQAACDRSEVHKYISKNTAYSMILFEWPSRGNIVANKHSTTGN